MTCQFDKAGRNYELLEENFKALRSKDLINLLWGMILIPLSNERKIQEDQYVNMLDYLDYMVAVK